MPMNLSTTQRLKALFPPRMRAWLSAPPPLPPDAPLIRRYLDGGRVPWSPGYREYRMRYVARVLRDEALLEGFRQERGLPPGYGDRLDERVVEFPWVLSRSAGWGRRILDAGSTLNHPALLELRVLAERHVVVCDLAHHWVAARAGVSYVTGDLRRLMVREGAIDVVACISTLEHIGLDNSMYTSNPRYRENRREDYRIALGEFRRVLAPGGRLLLTVPFGRAANLGWMQVFDERGIADLVTTFGGDPVAMAYFQLGPAGWFRSTARACADAEYFDVHARSSFDPDFAAAARAVACLELRRSVSSVA
jgi:SAM-dependent methyltransferase